MVITSALAAIAIGCVPVAAQAYENHALSSRYDVARAELSDSVKKLSQAVRSAEPAIAYQADTLPKSMGFMPSILSARIAEAAASVNSEVDAPRGIEGGALARTVADLEKEAKSNRTSAQIIAKTASEIIEFHDLKQLDDARRALDTATNTAQSVLAQASSKVDGDPMTNLADAIRSAQSVDAYDMDALRQMAAHVVTATAAVSDAIAAHDAQAARDAAQQERREATKTSTYSRRTPVSAAGQTYQSGNDTTDYTFAGDCYTAAECQAAIDGAGRNQVHALHTQKGSTHYEIHNDHGGSSTWGKDSVTINGQTHTLGQWRPATYVNGQPMEESQKGEYFQTCDANGKVWFAPIQ